MFFATTALILGLGLFFVVIVWNTLYGYWRTRDKVTVAAHLQSVELKRVNRHRCETVARYEYQVGERHFVGSEVSLFRYTDDFYEPLSVALKSNKPIRVYIDPQHPDFAVIDRSFSERPILVATPFSLMLIGFGSYILWHLWHHKEPKPKPSPHDRHPRSRHIKKRSPNPVTISEERPET
jgi:hypothetical protein